MVPNAGTKYLLATEVHDVTPARIVRTAQMLPKLFFTEIAQDCNFPDRIGPGDLRQFVQREAQDAHACPAPTRASQPDLGLIAGKTDSREAAKLRRLYFSFDGRVAIARSTSAASVAK
jgi:hypothetical protein